MQVTITLTSPVIREENMRDGGSKSVKRCFVLIDLSIIIVLRWYKVLEGNMLAYDMHFMLILSSVLLYFPK